jgi:sulfite reductase alpha subunit
MAMNNDFTHEYQDELHRPAFPYKFKFKFDGCPNGCVASIARSDLSVIGTWKDDIRIDDSAVKAYVGGELAPNAGAHSGGNWGAFDIQKEVIDLCPTECMSWDGSKLTIDNKNCVRCMHCINTMPRALRVGKETGATLLLGAKAPILDGQQLASMIVPFIPAEEPFDEIKEVVENLWDWWMEEGKNRERIGESMRRVGMQFMLNLINQEPVPQHVAYPRENPYIFWKEDEVPGGFDRSIEEYRKRHAR